MKNIFMIGNTHFDPVWLWRWDEAMASISATFRAALDRMKESPDFKYSFSAPCVFEWIKKTDKEMFEEIKQRVSEGRWELVEGWWTQADCNSAMGESYVRQALYAQQYFYKNFGMASETVFNIDSFGHSASMPQILSKCGIKNYVFWRPAENHLHFDQSLFVWESDGYAVLTYRVGGVGGEIFTQDIRKDTLIPLIKNKDTNHDLMVVYGVTDHGGAPTRLAITEIENIRTEYKSSHNIKFSTVAEYFKNQSPKNLLHVSGEFQLDYFGPYVNHTEIKKHNRIAEYSILNAEKAAVISEHLLSNTYPTEQLTQCWHDVMFNQFHDILGGASIKEAYFDARNLHGRAIQCANEIMHYSLQSVTRKIKMPGKNPNNAWNLVIWNLNGFEIDTVMEAEIQWAWEFNWYGGGIVLVDENDKEYPCQVIQESCVLPKFRTRIAFRSYIPSMGYKAFVVKQTNIVAKLLESEPERFENNRFVITYDSNGITALFDKFLVKRITNALFVPYAVHDECDTWGFNKDIFDTEKHFFELDGVNCTEQGFLRTTYRFVWRFKDSKVEQKVTIYDDFIDCSYKAYWNEESYVLKFMVSPCGVTSKCIVSIPYGTIERKENNHERPMGEWITLKGENTVSLLCDSIFSYDFDGQNLGLTLLRNCIYGDLRTEPLDGSKKYSYMGQGITEGKIRVLFKESIAKEASLMNNPPVMIVEANHDGLFPATNSFFKTNMTNMLLTTMKKSEEGNDTILRAYDTETTECSGYIELFDRSTKTRNSKNEIKTILVNKHGFYEASMLENYTNIE